MTNRSKNSKLKSNLLHEMVHRACASQSLAGMETTVEKELLHYDIMAALSQSGLLTKLTFQGGTCLRMAYGSQRLSEDLDFVGGVDFSPEDYKNLAQVLIDYFKPRYGLVENLSKKCVDFYKEKNFKKLLNKLASWSIL